jgi:hypothetical protein
VALAADRIEWKNCWRFCGGVQQQGRLHFERTAQWDDMYPVVKSRGAVNTGRVASFVQGDLPLCS